MDSFGRFIVSLVSGSRERVRGDLLDFPGTASRLSPFALLLVLHPPFFTLLRGQTDQRIRRYYSNEKMFKCTDGTTFPRVLLRCLPPLFSGERCELFSWVARIYTHTAQYSDHCNVLRTMPIYIREICRFFVLPTLDSLIYVHTSIYVYHWSEYLPESLYLLRIWLLKDTKQCCFVWYFISKWKNEGSVFNK